VRTRLFSSLLFSSLVFSSFLFSFRSLTAPLSADDASDDILEPPPPLEVGPGGERVKICAKDGSCRWIAPLAKGLEGAEKVDVDCTHAGCRFVPFSPPLPRCEYIAQLADQQALAVHEIQGNQDVEKTDSYLALVTVLWTDAQVDAGVGLGSTICGAIDLETGEHFEYRQSGAWNDHGHVIGGCSTSVPCAPGNSYQVHLTVTPSGTLLARHAQDVVNITSLVEGTCTMGGAQ
jgi:hypothetical protein